MEYFCRIPSPVGLLTVASDGEAVTGLWLEGQRYFAATLEPQAEEKDLPVFGAVRKWLRAYFEGERPAIPMPLAPRGGAFRQTVWECLRGIPYGAVTTYGDIAARLREAGAPTSARAVGGAVAHNPISILIPCHRVVGSDGSLTGYAGGLENKIRLLRLERAPLDRLRLPGA